MSKRTRLTEKKSKKISGAGISRRTLLIGASAVVAFPAIIVRQAKAADPLVFSLWGGSFTDGMVEAFLKPFTKDTGIPVIPAVSPNVSKVKAQVQAGTNEWDLVCPLSGHEVQGANEGLWEPLDYSIIDMSNTPAAAKRPFSIAFTGFGGGICWSSARNAARDKHPETWPEFWDTAKFPGRRGLRTRAEEMLEIALLADGVPIQQLYPLDVNRAFKSLDKLKSKVSNWIEGTEQTITLVQRNDCDFTYTYHSRVYAAKQAGVPVEYSFKQNLLQPSLATIVKNTPKKAAAMKLVAYLMKPDRQAAFAALTSQVPTRSDALPMVAENVRKALPPLEGPDVAWKNPDWWGANSDAVERRYKEWLIT